MRHVVALSSGEAAGIEDDQLTLRDPAGRVVARYSHAGGLRVEVPDGDLILAAPRGRVVLEGEIIDMKSRRWNTHAQRATMTAGRWELRADRAVERFDDLYRTCRGGLQVRAERMRHLVDRAYDLIAGRTSIASDEETKIDGKKVLLG